MHLVLTGDRVALRSLFDVVCNATIVTHTVVFGPIVLVSALIGEPVLPLGVEDRVGRVGLGLLGVALMPVSGAVNGIANGLAVCVGLTILRSLGRPLTARPK